MSSKQESVNDLISSSIKLDIPDVTVESTKKETKTTSRKSPRTSKSKKTTSTPISKTISESSIEEALHTPEVIPEVYIQSSGLEVTTAHIIAEIKKRWKACSEETIHSFNVYIKPEERTAYYVINETPGKLSLK